MPPYQQSPLSPVQQLLPNVPGYAFGTKPTGPNLKFIIDHVSVAANVVTLTGTVVEGNIPAIGDLIFVSATSQNAGALNTSAGIAISAVSITSTTGKGTISYPVTTGNLSITADTGYATSIPVDIGESLTNSTSQAFAVPEVGAGKDANGITITWSTAYPSAPGAVSMALQASETNIDAQYATLDTSTAVGGETRTITLTRYRFLRVKASGVSGGSSPTSVVKINI